MGYKCTPQIKGLVRGEPAPKAKHRANGRKMCEEFGNERYSKSETLDRTRSILNEYGGFKSGGKCWDYMCSEADSHIIKGRTKNGKEFERHLPHNAVIGYSVILNPPAGMTAGWTKDDYERFYSDSMEALNFIEPRIFRMDTICMTAEHKDEGIPDADGNYGEHLHFAGIPKDTEGHYCGNLIDAKLMDRINEAYPAFMREHGWDFDDLDRTDFKRCGEDPEYAKERNEKRKNQGRSVNKFRADEAAIREMNIYLCEEMDAERFYEECDLDDELREKRYEAHEQLKAERKEAGELKSAAEEQLIHAAKSRRDADALKGVYEQKTKELDNLIAEVKNFVNKPSTVSEDNDSSRKAYMESLKMPNGISAEDAYQKKLAREKKAEDDRKAKADAYVKKAEQIREPSKQVGKQLNKPNSAVKKAFAIYEDAEEWKKRENDMQYY